MGPIKMPKIPGQNELKELLKIFPAILSALKFMVLDGPKFFIKQSKLISKFFQKAAPLSLSIFILFFVIFFGIQVFFKKVTDTPDLIPHYPLIAIVIGIIYYMVMSTTMVESFQTYVYKFFVIVFGNPVTKSFYNFKLESKDKPSIKDMALLLGWITTHPVHVVLTLYVYYKALKITLKHTKSYVYSLPYIGAITDAVSDE